MVGKSWRERGGGREGTVLVMRGKPYSIKGGAGLGSSDELVGDETWRGL